MKKIQKLILAVNIAVISAIFYMNYVYQCNGFDFTLKCICSASFALLGVINLVYSLITKAGNKPFYIGMSAGLLLAFLGDVLIEYDFIVGAATFALAHVGFIASYCFLQKMQKLDYVTCGVLFLGCLIFLLFWPFFSFSVAIFRVVCIIYALFISMMLGKAMGNFIREKNLVKATIAVASALFFFSNLMLVCDRFIRFWGWTEQACMGTYYPALCFLALAMCIKSMKDHQ